MELKFIPVVWSRTSTPEDLREYALDGSSNPCGTIEEIVAWFKANYSSGVLRFLTLEGLEIEKVVE